MLPYNWREKLSPTAIRDTLNANSKVVALVMVVVIVVALAYMLKGSFGSHAPTFSTKGYFIDEETGEVTVGPKLQYPPLMGKGGKPTVVRVYYYTCTNCDEKQAAYYEKFTEEAKAIFERPAGTPWAPGDESKVQLGRLIRSPEPGSPWLRVVDKDAQAVQSRIQCPNGVNPVECEPK